MKIYLHDTSTNEGLVKYYDDLRSDSPVFKAIEDEFNDFIDNSNPASELHDMYFSEDAIYDKRGAIEGAYELIRETMVDLGIKSIDHDDHRIDYCAAFM